MIVAMMMEISEAGTTAFHFFGKANMNTITNAPSATAARFGWKPSVP